MHRGNIGAQRVERGGVRFAARANDDVERRVRAQRGQQTETRELAQATLEPVAIDGGVLMARHDDPDTGKGERGSLDPDIEVCGPNALPLSNDAL